MDHQVWLSDLGLSTRRWDTHGPSPDDISAGVEWALQQRAQGRACYVHCAHGHGRSAVVLSAIFIELGVVKTIPEALQLMQTQRPRVRLNRRQAATLAEWERRRNSVTKAA